MFSTNRGALHFSSGNQFLEAALLDTGEKVLTSLLPALSVTFSMYGLCQL